MTKLVIGDVHTAINITIELGHFWLSMLISRALKFPKDALRQDADAQVHMYELCVEEPSEQDRDNMEGSPMKMSNGEKQDSAEYSMKWDRRPSMRACV